MNREEHPTVSEEQLNAYIDNELDIEERHQLFTQLGQDDTLRREVDELRQLRAALQHAYHTPPAAPKSSKRNVDRRGIKNGLAASLLLTLGALGGWYGNAQMTANQPYPLLSSARSDQPIPVPAQKNLLLHLSSDDPARMAATLNYAEQLLAQHRNEGTDFHLEVIANDGGIALLRNDTSPYAHRIAALLDEYDNVTFLACANALRNLRQRGVTVELIPGVRSDDTAIDKITNRIKGGWHYLKV
ncbi:MAG TPA: hypothetical protein VIQ22_08775 [Gammaproteobacteria bacterium]